MSNQRSAINDIGGAQFGLTCATSTALTRPTGKPPPQHCLINVNAQAVRYTTDGTAPTATKGIHVAVGGQISFMDAGFNYASLIEKIRIIEEVGGATLDCLYFD